MVLKGGLERHKFCNLFKFKELHSKSLKTQNIFFLFSFIFFDVLLYFLA